MFAINSRRSGYIQKIVFGGGVQSNFSLVFVRQDSHAVIETGNSHRSVRIVQLGDDLCQDVGGVGDVSSKKTGVEIHFGTINAHFKINHSTQSGNNGGGVFVDHARVWVEDHVTFEHVSMLFDKIVERWRTNLLLALKKELDINRKLAGS